MTFHWANLLWLLLVPGVLGLWEFRRRRASDAQDLHPKIMRAEAGTKTLELKPKAKPLLRRRLRWRLLLGLTFAIVALARPQWGQLDEPVFDQAREIMIALDLSRSMLAPDIRPSRLDRAKLLVESLLQRLTGERVGLIVFSGTAFLQSPLSSDYEILNEFLPALTPDYLPEGGTNYEQLIDTALNAFGTNSTADRFLIILSDGEATDENWKVAAEKLKAKGIHVIGLGVGTAAGAMLPDTGGGFIKDERGAVVLSKLEPGTLKALANLTNGTYADASSWVDLAQLLQSTVESGKKGSFREERQVRLVERFQWALGSALIFFLWSFWQEFPVYPRSRDIKLSAVPGGKTLAPKPAGSVQSVLPWALVFIGLFAASPRMRALEALPNPIPPSSREPANAGAETDAIAAPLSHLIGQFSSRDHLSAHDYAELAQTTVTYGERVRSSHQDLPEGPIRDGLSAVETGRSLSPTAAEWDKLHDQLNNLLQKPPTPTPPPQDKNQDKSKQDKSKNDQSKNDQSKSDQSKNDPSQKDQAKDNPSKSSDGAQDKTQSNNASEPSPTPESAEKTQNPQSSLHDMEKSANEKPTPTPASNGASPETQKVGGARDDRDQGTQPTDPALAVPLQRLQQVKDGDSPIKIQQLIRGTKPTPAHNGKNW